MKQNNTSGQSPLQTPKQSLRQPRTRRAVPCALLPPRDHVSASFPHSKPRRSVVSLPGDIAATVQADVSSQATVLCIRASVLKDVRSTGAGTICAGPAPNRCRPSA